MPWLGTLIASATFVLLVAGIVALVWKYGDDFFGMNMHHNTDDPKNHQLTLLELDQQRSNSKKS